MHTRAYHLTSFSDVRPAACILLAYICLRPYCIDDRRHDGDDHICLGGVISEYQCITSASWLQTIYAGGCKLHFMLAVMVHGLEMLRTLTFRVVRRRDMAEQTQ